MKHKRVELPHLEYDELYQRYGRVVDAARMKDLEAISSLAGCPPRIISTLSEMFKEIYKDVDWDALLGPSIHRNNTNKETKCQTPEEE